MMHMLRIQIAAVWSNGLKLSDRSVKKTAVAENIGETRWQPTALIFHNKSN